MRSGLNRVIMFFTMTFFIDLDANLLMAQESEMVICYIRGKAFREKGNAELNEGQSIMPKEKIHFNADEDFIIAITKDKKKLRYKITSQLDRSAEKGNEKWEQVALMMRLLWESPTLTTRSDEFPYLETEFEVDSTINPKLLFINSNKYLFEPGKFLSDENHFFFLQVQNESKNESQALTTIKDTLMISLESLNSLQEKLGAERGKYYLGYFDKANNRAKMIASFEPELDREGKLRRMVRAIINVLGTEAGKPQIFNEAYAEAFYFLGKPSMISLKEIIDDLY